jgi:hypothetical protein
MTPPQYPYFPPPQYPATPAWRRVRASHSLIDIVITAVVSALAAVAAGLGGLGFPLLFAMGMGECETDFSSTPVFVVWGGVAIAVIIAGSGTIIAALRGWVMWIWPTLALGLIVAATVIGWQLAKSVTCPM